MAPANSGLAIASLVCSLVGLFFVPVIGSLLGIIFGTIALRQIKESQGQVRGRELAISGIIVGAVGVVVGACVVIGLIALFADPNFLQSLPQN